MGQGLFFLARRLWPHFYGVGVALLAVASSRSPARAELLLDGSLGAAGALAGPSYAIPAALGRERGGNLFHSFAQFNLAAGESATFSGPETVGNVIARVSGGTPSTIDGALRVAIPGANLWLLNPAGVAFGSGATVDLSGSLHVTTADYLTLGAGDKFFADPAATSQLSAAPPSAFGFLDRPAYATISNSGMLEVAEGKTISIVGGDIYSYRGSFYAPSGTINLLAAASAGEAFLPGAALRDHTFPRLGDITLRGDHREYRQIHGFYNPLGVVEVGGAEQAGSIYVRAGSFTLRGSSLESGNYGDQPGGEIDLWVSGALDLRLDATISSQAYLGRGRGSAIKIEAGSVSLGREDEPYYTGRIISESGSWSTGQGGEITIKTGSLVIREFFYTDYYGMSRSGIVTASSGSGRGGKVTVAAERLDLLELGEIKSTASHSGDGGDLAISAGEIRAANQAYGKYASGIASEASGSGRGGNISLHAASLSLSDSGLIRSFRQEGSGEGGDVAIVAESLTVTGMNVYSVFEEATISDYFMRSGISTDTSSLYSTAKAGNLQIAATTLTVADGGTIISSSERETWGRPGDIAIVAKDILVTGNRQGADFFASNIGSETWGFLPAGKIEIQTGSLTLADSGRINTNALLDSQGDAGNITITAARVAISGHGQHQLPPFAPNVYRSGITSESFALGKPGNITITSQQLTIADAGIISTSAAKTFLASLGQAGTITITAEEVRVSGYYDNQYALYPSAISSDSWGYGNAGEILLHAGRVSLANLGAIRTNVWQNAGDGGNISVDCELLTIAGAYRSPSGAAASGIQSESWAAGDAGNIVVRATSLLLGAAGTISTDTHASGQGGTILLRGEEGRVEGGAAITATSSGSGAGGGIALELGRLLVAGGGQIAAASSGAGSAGDILLRARESVALTGGGAISTATQQAGGGGIVLAVGRLLHLQHGEISTSVRGGMGNGGNIEIDPEYVILDHGQIVANAYGGNGGNIHLVATTYLADPASRVTASSALAIDGTVRIDSPESDVSAAVTLLPGGFLLNPALVSNSCAARTAERASSLLREGRSAELPGERRRAAAE